MSSYKEYDLISNRKIILLHTFQDLFFLLKKPSSQYTLVRIGAILRFLYISDGGFLNIINKEFNFKTKKFLNITYRESSGISSIKDTHFKESYLIDINTNSGNKLYSFNDLLKIPALINLNPYLNTFLNEKHISNQYNLKELINLISNGHGGVHIQNWDTNKIPLHVANDIASPFNLNRDSVMHNILRKASYAFYFLSLEIIQKAETTIRPNSISASTSITIKGNKNLD